MFMCVCVRVKQFTEILPIEEANRQQIIYQIKECELLMFALSSHCGLNSNLFVNI
jgi:hypothetical protein